MSSEDSDDDGSFNVRQLPWRSEKATEILYALDNKHTKKVYVRSRRMTFARTDGDMSDRDWPEPGTVPQWSLT